MRMSSAHRRKLVRAMGDDPKAMVWMTVLLLGAGVLMIGAVVFGETQRHQRYMACIQRFTPEQCERK
jgi:hypothetical protein